MPISKFEIPSEVRELLRDSARSDASVYFYNGQWLEPYSKLGNVIAVKTGGPEEAVRVEVKGTSDQRITLVHLYGNLQDVEVQKPFSVSCGQNYHILGKAEIIETHLALNEIEFNVQNRSTFTVESGGSVTFGQTYWLGDEAKIDNKVALRLPEKSAFNGLNLNIGSAQFDNQMDVDLAGEKASCELRSLILATRRQQVNTVSNIRHLVGDTKSEQLVKAVVNERAKVHFTGNVLIAKDAQKADARQLSQTLLLSRSGEAMTRPQLDVGADDVSATHGATVGQLDEAQLFYLMSRGLARTEARHTLALAYQRDVFDRLTSAFVKEHLERIHSQLPAEMSAEFLGETAS